MQLLRDTVSVKFHGGEIRYHSSSEEVGKDWDDRESSILPSIHLFSGSDKGGGLPRRKAQYAACPTTS